jgi:hypothetical protein
MDQRDRRGNEADREAADREDASFGGPLREHGEGRPPPGVPGCSSRANAPGILRGYLRPGRFDGAIGSSHRPS